MSAFHSAKFRFGAVRQDVGDKHQRLGDLLEAINVRQTKKAGVYAKRRGFARTAQTFSGGTLSGTPLYAVPGANDNTLMRDTGDQLWGRDATSNKWTKIGDHRRPWATTKIVQSNTYTVPQPFCCLVGTSLWTFALNTNAYEFSIVDAAKGTVTTARTSVTATGIVHASAVYDGTHVWLFWVDNGANGTIRLHKFANATPTSTPTASNYYTFPSSPTNVSTVALQQVQARYFSANNRTVVVACGGSLVSTTYKRALGHSVLDPATSLPATGALAPYVDVAFSGATTSSQIGGLSILDGQDGSGSYWYFQYAGWSDSIGSVNWRLNRVDMANSNNPVFVVSEQSATASCLFATRGYHDATANAQYCWLTQFQGSSVTNPLVTAFFQVNAGSTTIPSTPFTRPGIFDWVASGFAKQGSDWYTLNGFDDFGSASSTYFGSESLTTQRMYHLCRFIPGATADASRMSIVAQVAPGGGPGLWHRASIASLAYTSATQGVSGVPQLLAVGTGLATVCALAGSALTYVDVAWLGIDLQKTYAADCMLGRYAVSPGNIPVIWNAQIGVHEISPLSAPSYFTITGGAGTDFNSAAVVFVIADSDGVLYRSAPKVFQGTVGHGAVIGVPRPPHALDGTTVKIEIYLATAATLKLQTVITPSASDLFVSTWITPTAAASATSGEDLYSTGGALINTWPVSCQAAAVWRNRLFLAQGNVLWTSGEMTDGLGPLFNEVQKSTWYEEPGDITAIGAVDWNYLALLSENRPAVISGDGPNGRGQGNYVIHTLSSLTGCSAGHAAIQGARGCYYQGKDTGRLMAITSDLQVSECAGGAYDYVSYDFTAAAWTDQENQVLFFAPASKAMVAIDYQHTQDVAPFGQVYLNTFTSLTPAAVTVDGSGLLVIDSTGAIFRPGSNWVDDTATGTESYRMKLTTAQLQMSDIGGEFNVSTIYAMVTLRSATGLTLTVYPDLMGRPPVVGDTRSSSRSVSLSTTNPGDAVSISHRPSSCARIQGFVVSLEEAASVTGQSFEFEALGVEYTTSGRWSHPSAGRVI